MKYDLRDFIMIIRGRGKVRPHDKALAPDILKVWFKLSHLINRSNSNTLKTMFKHSLLKKI